MKNILRTNEINEFVDKYLDSEFSRIQEYTYIDLKLVPTEEQCRKEWEVLVNSNKAWTYSNIIRRFHPSIVFANKEKQSSPFDKWEEIKSDVNKFKNLFINRLTYNKRFRSNGLPKDGSVPLHIYAQGMNVMRWSPEVSYFKPALAKYIIKKYLDKYNVIFNPFS